jgi:hypothetical protein
MMTSGEANEDAGEPSGTQGDPRIAFPIIDRDRFEQHPKGPRADAASPLSEDWVTWTTFRLQERYALAT